jgi:hypothetical protein
MKLCLSYSFFLLSILASSSNCLGNLELNGTPLIGPESAVMTFCYNESLVKDWKIILGNNCTFKERRIDITYDEMISCGAESSPLNGSFIIKLGIVLQSVTDTLVYDGIDRIDTWKGILEIEIPLSLSLTTKNSPTFIASSSLLYSFSVDASFQSWSQSLAMLITTSTMAPYRLRNIPLVLPNWIVLLQEEFSREDNPECFSEKGPCEQVFYIVLTRDSSCSQDPLLDLSSVFRIPLQSVFRSVYRYQSMGTTNIFFITNSPPYCNNPNTQVSIIVVQMEEESGMEGGRGKNLRVLPVVRSFPPGVTVRSINAKAAERATGRGLVVRTSSFPSSLTIQRESMGTVELNSTLTLKNMPRWKDRRALESFSLQTVSLVSLFQGDDINYSFASHNIPHVQTTSIGAISLYQSSSSSGASLFHCFLFSLLVFYINQLQ